MHETLLWNILSQPTAPYREMHVQEAIRAALEKGRVPHFLDPVGNIVVGVSSRKEYDRLIQRRTEEPVRIFIAHMDHPGFHGQKWVAPNELEIRWFGGSPIEHLAGAPVWVANSGGVVADGEIVSAVIAKSGWAIDTAVLRFSRPLEPAFPKPRELFGGFAFREFVWRDGDLIYTKAADDLVGAFAIVSLALDLFKGPKKSLPFLAVLTRAEEVGFIGCIGHMELGWLKRAKRPLLCVSLETSRTLPGAEIGKGPVVRLGDKFTVFSAGALRVFTELAQKALPEKHQRRIMDGGTCEATAATVYGIPAIGISVPLGNYHNQSFEGGPDSRGPKGPAPEFVHLSDIEGLLALCKALLKTGLPWQEPWKKRRQDFARNLRKAKALLRAQ